MKRKTKQIDPIPDEFQSYKEAGEFWDIHDTADYSNIFRTVETGSRPRQISRQSSRRGISAVIKRGRGRRVVARKLWQSNDRLDYDLYLKQVALLPQEPMAYRP
jgi:hypothetical protein